MPSWNTSIFNNLNESDTYSTYKVYIFRENDTIDGVLQKYSITKETLSLYNNIEDIKVGTKLIIPYESWIKEFIWWKKFDC